MDLKNEFERETGQGIGYLEGSVSSEENGTYNDAYVEWLESKLKNQNNLSNLKAIQNYLLEHGSNDEEINEKIRELQS